MKQESMELSRFWMEDGVNALGTRQENEEYAKPLPCHLPLSLEKTHALNEEWGHNERTKLSLQCLK